ncbi:hypothetical protein [Flavobacterium sp.]|jgi:hypothetical protein|uniref:hypothetical protein n=1 Tax=Flavobacterium sp. TaxID=239 RepID=UPI0037BF770D
MLKIIIVAMLMLVPLVATAQSENRITYTVDSYHNRGCLGGTGTCPETKIESSTEKTTAFVAKTGKSNLQLSLEKAGFTAKDWEELLDTKTFLIDDESVKVDRELLRLLAIDPKFNSIKRGLYPVTFLEDKAIVVFELIERN